ncbi:serine/threonine-protein kinase [Streptomyces sp. AN-3]|uniref:serine/threonine-protein kinase n=1 Tax=Streptomyces TaxID=1883 RepID=UPI000A3AC027|nr:MULTISPECIES: serine/threonine-protein kinase [Streptomyces]MDI3099449.1 serine/threonine-protein kinase [Streptomyces sp. AN-3]
MLGGLGASDPRHVGPYRILARLGAGGMGEVYLGADTRPGPSGGEPGLAAVKVVRADLGGDPALRDRFRKEITTARTVEGRFTARLLSADMEAAEPWMATEYVAGPTLDRAVRETGPLPVGTVLDLGLALARALRGIHRAQVRHRDLKPANVLLGADGPRVIDFGIARDFGASTMTATGAMVGSPGYMSPEHVLGGSHVVAASDVFCLAAVLCFAATGEAPFGSGPVAAVLYRISQADADLAAVPGPVRDLIADCLSADPFARPDAVALEARFKAAVREAGGADDATVVWPPAVRSLVDAHRRELARVVAQAGPVSGRTPTMPGASPVHSAETVTGPPAPPVTPPPGRPAGPSRRTLVTVIAAAAAVGVLGAFALRAVQDPGEPDRPEAGGGGASPTASASAAEAMDKPSGLGENGVDGTRHYPADPSARPEGWRQWNTKLPGRPRYCALNPEILVCRTVDGGLVAVGAADGEQRWKAPSTAPGEKAAETPMNGTWLPGGAKEPLIHGDTVVSYAGGKVRGRSVSDGRLRWERALSVGEVANRTPLLTGGGAVFVTAHDQSGVIVHAFDTETGEPLWHRTLSTRTGTGPAGSHSMALAYADGRVVASTDNGVAGFDARTGATTHAAVDGECENIRAVGERVLCSTGTRTVALDTKKYAPAGTPAFDPLNDWPGAEYQGAHTLAWVDGTTPYRLEQVGTPGSVVLQKKGEARTRTVGGRPLPAGARASAAVIVGGTAVVADNRYLYTLPVAGGDGERYEIQHAPGNGRGRPDAEFGMEEWEPRLISLGGVLFLAFHDGTVRSFELPTA